jgi:tryptophan-rich sensory protein
MNQSYTKTVNPTVKLIVSLVLTLLVGFGAGFATATSINSWYSELHKPFFNPPNWLFAPVWTILYILMGIAFYLVWKLPETAQRNIALFVFVLQLTVNGIWSLIFFHQHQIGWALFDIVILWAMIIITMYLFTPLSKLAAWLLYPYLLWVSFATVLNFSIWQLN